tara:strand:+ start:1283 stop:1540 length:258 start_codon:yes stop_codon:yes gene_type:complete
MEVRGDINSTVDLGKDIQEIKNTVADTYAVFDLSQDLALRSLGRSRDVKMSLSRCRPSDLRSTGVFLAPTLDAIRFFESLLEFEF